MQENKDSGYNTPNWETKSRAFIKGIKKPEDKALRWKALLPAAFGGFILGCAVNLLGMLDWIGVTEKTPGRVSVVILIISLPTLALLWWFRTYDTRQQIQKTQESINANLFGIYLKMLLSNEKKERVAGLLGMMDMKTRQEFFEEEIDNATQQNIDLSETDLTGKNLSGMCLSGANFEKSQMLEILFDYAGLGGVNFSHADLSCAILDGAYLAGANFSHANLTESQLVGSRGAQAIFTDANLTKALMVKADFFYADFSRANMRNSQLYGANLFLSNLTGADLTGATYDNETKFPDGFDPKTAGMKLVESIHRRKPSDEGADGE